MRRYPQLGFLVVIVRNCLVELSASGLEELDPHLTRSLTEDELSHVMPDPDEEL